MSTFLQPLSPVLGAGESVSQTTLTNSVPIGTQWADASGNQYVYCYNASNSQLSQGQFVNFATFASSYSISITNISVMALGVGIVRNATMATAAYGWIMTKGFCGLSTDNCSFVTYQAVSYGQNGNLAALTAAAGSFVTSPIIGQALVSIPTQTTCSTAANLNSFWISMP